jgi:hypothetical protein
MRERIYVLRGIHNACIIVMAVRHMSLATKPLIAIDWELFDPWRVTALTHSFAEHPLLQTKALVALAKRCRGTNRWYTFSNAAKADTDFDEAARLHPSTQSAVDSLRNIDTANAWVLLRHIQADPTYRAMVDEAFDPIVGQIEQKDPGMYFRAGWIFSASPHTATPFHIDRSHVILLQARGCKTVYVWDPRDTDVVSDAARDCFHARHDLSRTRWNDAFRERAHVYHLSPGTGVYMPLTSPHMVETSDESSLTVSFTYNTHATRRIAKIHVLRETMRRLGMHVPAVRANDAFDRAALAVSTALIACGGPGSHQPACASLRLRAAYATPE